MIDLEDKLLIAVPKKGRLYEKTIYLLKKSGLFYSKKERLDIAFCTNMPVGILFLPAKDIAFYVGDGEVDLGITGQDVIRESDVKVNEVLPLHFGHCKLCVQAPINKYTHLNNLIGKRIVTSFPNITTHFFNELSTKVPSHIRTISGSVEVACSLGLGDAIVDLVQTGETMKASGLEIVHEIMPSQAVLIRNPESKKAHWIERIQKRIQGVVNAEKHALIEYNIQRIKLKKGEKITPGKLSPTVLPLENSDWVAVKSMILKQEAHDLMEQLEEIGATDILVYDVDNCRI